jgi:hypothetical protein
MDPSLAEELKKINVYTVEASNAFPVIYNFFVNSHYTPYDYDDPLDLNLVYTLAMNSVKAPRMADWERLVKNLDAVEKRDLLARLTAYTRGVGNAVIINVVKAKHYVIVAVSDKDVENLGKLVKAKK